MKTDAFNQKKYGRLLLRVLPKPISTEQEYDEFVALTGQLMEKGEDSLSPEEGALLELLAILVQDYDEHHYPLGEGSPRDMLLFLMEQHNLRQKDLVPVLGSSSVVSAVVNGKRGISKRQAKKLSELFHCSADLFI
jgi:HTH-type transcriptional regulator/antitoxin HigA